MSRCLHRHKVAELLPAARSDVRMTLVELASAIGVEPDLDTERSDIDLLVGTTSETSLFGLGAFVLAVEELTGFPVDVLTDDLRGDPHFEHVLAEAVPL